MPAKKTAKKKARKGVYTISRATTKCAQKLGAKGGRAKARNVKKRSSKRAPSKKR